MRVGHPANDPWIIEDARWTRVRCPTPWCRRLGLQFYAGIPLHTRDGYNCTMCIIDRRPRTLSHQTSRHSRTWPPSSCTI